MDGSSRVPVLVVRTDERSFFRCECLVLELQCQLSRWGLEFCAGIGGAVLQYDRFDCDGSNEAAERATRFCFGPGRVGISLVFVIK